MYNEKWDRNKWKDALSKEQFLTFEKFSNSDWIDESLFEYNPRQLMFVLHLMCFQGVVDSVKRSSYQLLDDRIVQIGMTNNLAIKSLDTEIDRVLDLSVQYDQSLSIKESIKSDITFIDYIMNKNTSNKIANNLYDYKSGSINFGLNKKANKTYLRYHRNIKWLKILVKEFEDQNCFAAVGVGHLYNKSGLLQLLIKDGYKVETYSI